MKYTPRLKQQYTDEVVPKLKEQFNYKTIMQVPRLMKICINQGVGEATQRFRRPAILKTAPCMWGVWRPK